MIDMVNQPPHYNSHPSGVECIQITRLMSFAAGNAVKYVFRADHKNGDEDYRKALWYLDDVMRHAAAPFALGRYSQAAHLLDRVAASETDPNRLRFFIAVANHQFAEAKEAITALIG